MEKSEEGRGWRNVRRGWVSVIMLKKEPEKAP